MTFQRQSQPKRIRKGMVAVFVALCLVAIVSITAIVIDGGMLLQERRHGQATADAAALAAALQLWLGEPANGGLDGDGSAKKSALAVADDNGYANDGKTSNVTINIPPQSG